MEYGEPVELEKIDVARGIRRYYRLWLRPDLFAQICLTRQWGRIGHNGGQVRTEPFDDAETAQAALERLVIAKKRKGYKVTGAYRTTRAATSVDGT